MGPEEELRRQHALPQRGGVGELAGRDQLVEPHGLVRHGIDAAPDAADAARDQRLEGERIAAVEDLAAGRHQLLDADQVAGAVLDVLDVVDLQQAREASSGVMSRLVFCGML